MKRLPTRLLVVLAILVLLVGVAVARPGGGESYSGGGGHSSGGGGGGGGGGDVGFIFELIYWIIRLCIYYPQIGLPLLGVVIVYVAYSAFQQHRNKDWDSGPPLTEKVVELDAIRDLDPDFSQVVFEDFVFRLFSTAHRARSSAESLQTIAPYVSAAARGALAEREPKGVAVQQVIVGAMRPYRVDVPAGATNADGSTPRVHVGIEFEANVATADHTYFSVENWLLGRAASVTSKPPTASRTFPCPHCGAPWQASDTGTQKCASCGQIVDNGRFDWAVDQIVLISLDERPPTLTAEVPERGTSLATYIDDDFSERYRELQAGDPEVTDGAITARVELIFREVGQAWSKNDLRGVRGLVSDGLFDYLDYWVHAYKQQGLRNVMADTRITRTELAKVVRDRWYDSLTIRIWATGHDYVVVEQTGKVVRGSKHRDRPYSEYWTLIRSAGRKGPARADRSCGNCGAPLNVTMAGACEHCGAHVTGGEFDWVLSKIEQDDSYRG